MALKYRPHWGRGQKKKSLPSASARGRAHVGRPLIGRWRCRNSPAFDHRLALPLPIGTLCAYWYPTRAFEPTCLLLPTPLASSAYAFDLPLPSHGVTLPNNTAPQPICSAQAGGHNLSCQSCLRSYRRLPRRPPPRYLLLLDATEAANGAGVSLTAPTYFLMLAHPPSPSAPAAKAILATPMRLRLIQTRSPSGPPPRFRAGWLPALPPASNRCIQLPCSGGPAGTVEQAQRSREASKRPARGSGPGEGRSEQA